LVGDMSDTPMLKKAPVFVKDSLIFPYIKGMSFSAAALKLHGWSGLPDLFTKPPVTTQQILHPALYQSGKVPPALTLPPIDKSLGANWTKLEDNILGEFGLTEILKVFLGETRARPLAAAWDGDRYVVYEQKQTKRLILLTRLRLSTEEQASRFSGQYSE